MTQEQKELLLKELLLKDLCARLPYGVKVNNEIQGDFEIYGICENFVFGRRESCHIDFDVEKIKPYLFPLSSMTEEQVKEYDVMYEENRYYWRANIIDWFNKNHFDYRGLIPMGLAEDATGKNIY